MKTSMIFAKRNLIEMGRDVLSYIFCVAFPIVMLIIMSLVNESIPAEANMNIFRIDQLLGGVIVFGQTFLMLFTALMVSKDRGGAFLMRLYASPMEGSDFTNGYILPMILIGVCQVVISSLTALVIAKVVGFTLNPLGLFLALVVSLPSAVMFIGIGLIFGTLFNQNAAPGLCSIIISLGSFIGGVWFDAEGTGGVILKVSKCFPFLYATKSIRAGIGCELSFEGFVVPLLVVTVVAGILVVLSSVVFHNKMKVDLS